MEQNYDTRKVQENRNALGTDRTTDRQGWRGFAQNSARAAALGGETPADPGLGSRMAAHMAAAFGQDFGSGTGIVQMKPDGEPDRNAPVSGEPDAIRSALERKSSVSLDDVRVHYNSPKPAEIGALAYARGTDVFMGPGQEKYLGHELTHVVQQKQGLVHSTGSIGGMPVNTSPALESAADHMQVSAAPATSASPALGGVVQGVFKDSRGKSLSEKDVDSMISMMEGSYDSHMFFSDDALKRAAQNGDKIEKKNVSRLHKAYQKSRSSLRKRYKEMMMSQEEYSPEDILGRELSSAQQNAAAKHFNPSDLHDAKVIGSVYASGTEYMRDYLHNARGSWDTTAGYLRTEEGFSLGTSAMDGVSDIADYDPEQQSFDDLIPARMGNSSTYGKLDKDSEEFRKKKDEFSEATEVARQGAINLRKSGEEIGFGDLFSLYSEINRTTRKGDDAGGKLRATMVTSRSGSVQGVGSGRLGEEAFRTFSTIAAQMNKIKNTKDRDLQKTQAIQLASFAYQMTVSEHMFGDANGRSSRLFSDTILQTFGLPPHSPIKEEEKIGGIIGQEMDFKKGAETFLKGVQASDRTMKGLPPLPELDSAGQQPADGTDTEAVATPVAAIGTDTVPMPEEEGHHSGHHHSGHHHSGHHHSGRHHSGHHHSGHHHSGHHHSGHHHSGHYHSGHRHSGHHHSGHRHSGHHHSGHHHSGYHHSKD